MAEKTQNIYQKLNNFRTSVEAIRKEKAGYNYKYADINEVLKVITEPLSKVGLIDVDTTHKDDNGQLWLETKLINVDNPEEFLKIETPLLMKNPNDPQALGSALTYARRYNRVTLLGLEQEDDDGNAAAGKTEQTQTKQTYPKPKQTDIRIKFLNFIVKEGIDKNHLDDFTDWMISTGYNIKDEKVKDQLLNQEIKFKKLIRAYLDTLKATMQ